MGKTTANMAYLVQFLVIFLCLKENRSWRRTKQEADKGILSRYRRWTLRDCAIPQDRVVQNVSAFRGYLALTNNEVRVEFIKQGSRHIAKVDWFMPKVDNAPRFPVTLVYRGMMGTGPYACSVVRNKTSIEIEPSPGWKYDENLKLIVIPLPSRPDSSVDILDYVPHYVESTRSPTTKSTFGSTVGNSSTTNLRESSGKIKPNVTKAVVGSVTGVSLAVILIVLVIIYYMRNEKRDGNKDHSEISEDFYYASYFPESKNFTKEVEEFVSWARERGFNVQMDSKLSDENELLSRELGPVRFIDVMLRRAKNVFMIVSPSYLKLCRMDEHNTEQKSIENVTQEENTIYYEIVNIKNDLVLTMFRGGRFVPVLFNVKDTQLPFWMKELVLYSWPRDANKLLYRLHNIPECAPANIKCQNI